MRHHSPVASVFVSLAALFGAGCYDDLVASRDKKMAEADAETPSDASVSPADADASVPPTDASLPGDAWARADAGPPDATVQDAGTGDAAQPVDAGPQDAAQPVDAGPQDAAQPVDAAPQDAAQPVDAGQQDAAQPVDAGQQDAAQPVDAGQQDAAQPVDAAPQDAAQPVCTATPRAIFVPGQASPPIYAEGAGIAVGAHDVFFAFAGGGGAASQGAVVACPKAGCTAMNARVITSGLQNPSNLIIAGAPTPKLYIADQSRSGFAGSIRECDLTGCANGQRIFAANVQGLSDMVYMGGKLFWHNNIGAAGNQYISGYDTVGNAASAAILHSGASIGLTTDGTSLFSSIQYAPEAIRTIHLAAGAWSTLLGPAAQAGGGSFRYGLTYANDWLYWSTSFAVATPAGLPGAVRGIYRMHPNGQGLEMVAQTGRWAGGLAVDPARGKVYYTAYNRNQLMEADIATHQERELAGGVGSSQMQPMHRHIDQDANCIYWTTHSGSVYTVAK